MLAAIAQEFTMSSGQDSSHLFLIVEDMGMLSELVIQADWAVGTPKGFGRSQTHVLPNRRSYLLLVLLCLQSLQQESC